MAEDDFEAFKKRYKSGQIKELANPPPIPGPGRLAAGLGSRVAGAAVSKVKQLAKEDSKVRSAKKPSGKKPQSPSGGKADKGRSGTLTDRARLGDRMKSRGPFGTLAKQGTREVTKFTRGARDVQRAEQRGTSVAGSRAVATTGSRAVATTGRGSNGGGRINVNANTALLAGSKGGSSALTADTSRKPQGEKRQAAGTYTKSYDRKSTTVATPPSRPLGSNAAAKSDKKTFGAGSAKPNTPARDAFNAKYNKDAVKKKNSTANQGDRNNKPTQRVKPDKNAAFQRA